MRHVRVFVLQRSVYCTHTSWNSSNDFCGVKTFNKLIIWKRRNNIQRINVKRELQRGIGDMSCDDC